MFQSSAAPKSGCNSVGRGELLAMMRVSILSRPEERL